MGKVARGSLGEPLLICGGDGSSPQNLVETHGVGCVKTWLESLVCMHRREGVRFFEEPCSWRSWFYQSQDIEWQHQRRKLDVAAGVVPDDPDAVRRVEDIPVPSIYEEGP